MALVAGALSTALAGYTNRAAEANTVVVRQRTTAAEVALAAARERFAASTNNSEAGWQLGRACFDLADAVASDARRAQIAREGIAVCRQVVAHSPRLAAGYYYLGLNLGELARTETFRALKIVKEMESVFKRAADLDPRFDYAGAQRSLGLLYQDAPGWPISVGSRKKARQQLQEAVKQAGDYPENHLCLLEAYLEWGDRKAAQAALSDVEAALKKARAAYAGERWAAAWLDWDARWAKVKEQVADPIRKRRSPRDQ